MPDAQFWQGKNVLITGHTGFKGSWLSLWLTLLGANVTGFSLEPPTHPNMFDLVKMADHIRDIRGDIRNRQLVFQTVSRIQPDIIFHMAAQPLVRDSYRIPAETYETNVLGTISLLEAVRKTDSIRAVVNVTTDKVYENREWLWGYRENEPLGGYDPYSSSKACSELVTAAYRNSYFNPADYKRHGVGLATARAGNVIGGGDWAADRLVPDCIRCFLAGRPVHIRNPQAIRPWQHVLEPLSGYLTLARHLYQDGINFAEGWNFGPEEADAKPVEWIVRRLCNIWGKNASYRVEQGHHPHEAHYLRLDCTKAKVRLNWQPRWTLEDALQKVVEWVKAYQNNSNLYQISIKQIQAYK